MLKLKCNKGCKQNFILMGVGTEVVSGDVQKHGFACPYCGKEYISNYTNTGIRALQKMQRELIAKPQSKKNRRLIKDLEARIRAGMGRLREEIENEKN